MVHYDLWLWYYLIECIIRFTCDYSEMSLVRNFCAIVLRRFQMKAPNLPARNRVSKEEETSWILFVFLVVLMCKKSCSLTTPVGREPLFCCFSRRRRRLSSLRYIASSPDFLISSFASQKSVTPSQWRTRFFDFIHSSWTWLRNPPSLFLLFYRTSFLSSRRIHSSSQETSFCVSTFLLSSRSFDPTTTTTTANTRCRYGSRPWNLGQPGSSWFSSRAYGGRKGGATTSENCGSSRIVSEKPLEEEGAKSTIGSNDDDDDSFTTVDAGPWTTLHCTVSRRFFLLAIACSCNPDPNRLLSLFLNLAALPGRLDLIQVVRPRLRLPPTRRDPWMSLCKRRG